MKGRIKELRKALGLTQQEFADKIGTARNNIAGYETGKRSPSEAVVSAICKTFKVDERWLRNGEGDMFAPKTEEDELTAAIERLLTGESPEFKRRLIVALSTLKEEHWILLEEKLKEIAGAQGVPPATLRAAARDGSRAETKPDSGITLPDSVQVMPQRYTAGTDDRPPAQEET